MLVVRRDVCESWSFLRSRGEGPRLLFLGDLHELVVLGMGNGAVLPLAVDLHLFLRNTQLSCVFADCGSGFLHIHIKTYFPVKTGLCLFKS